MFAQDAGILSVVIQGILGMGWLAKLRGKVAFQVFERHSAWHSAANLASVSLSHFDL